jgi:hypothetical protein
MAARRWIKTLGFVIAGLGIVNLVGFVAFWYGTGIGPKRLHPPESIDAYSPPMQRTPVTQVNAQVIKPKGLPLPEWSQNTEYAPVNRNSANPWYQEVRNANGQVVYRPMPYVPLGSGMGGGTMPVASWAKPQGGEPAWLIRGRKKIAAEEKIRDLLGNSISFDLQEITLFEALDAIREEIGSQQSINLLFDAKELQDLQVKVELADKRLNLKAEGSTREILRRVLTPFHLDYVIHADGIEIVGDESEALSIRTYNLSHLVSNSQDVEKITQVLEATVRPGKWDGGQTAVSKSIGPVLVVAAKELLHDEIEDTLAKLESMGLRNDLSMPFALPESMPGGGAMGSGMGSGGSNPPPGGNKPAPGVILPYPNTSAIPGIAPANPALDTTRDQTELYRKGLAPAPNLNLPGMAPAAFGGYVPQSNTAPQVTSGEPDLRDPNDLELPNAEVPSGVEPKPY